MVRRSAPRGGPQVSVQGIVRSALRNPTSWGVPDFWPIRRQFEFRKDPLSLAHGGSLRGRCVGPGPVYVSTVGWTSV